MLTKILHSDRKKIILSFISVLLFTYIILFEFILPANKLLPKPSILIESIPSLFKDYNFLAAFLFSFSAIYLIMIISYLFINVGKNYLIFFSQYFPGIKELFIIGKYLVPIFLIFLFQLWFGNSMWGEYLFILFLMMGELKSKILFEIVTIKEEYIITSRSLGLSEKEIIKNVVWKSIQPQVFDSFLTNHISIWSLVIIYEFICETEGIGSIFRLGLKYNDLSMVIVLIVLIILTILLMELVLNSIKKKYFFWK